MEWVENRKFVIKIIKYSFLLAGIMVLMFLIFGGASEDKNIKKFADQNLEDLEKLKKYASNAELSINKSLFEGFMGDLSPYKILARTVDKFEEGKYRLKLVDADYILDQSVLRVNAKAGTFDSLLHLVILEDNVVISFDGLVLRTEKIDIDTETKNACSDSPVVVNYKNSQIISDKFSSEDASDVVKFEGNVNSKLCISDFNNKEEPK